MKVLLMILLFSLPQTRPTAIESLTICLVPKDITHNKLDGVFQYYDSNPESGVYKSVFIGNGNTKYRYLHFNSGVDSLMVDDMRLAVPEKYDPLTIRLYKILFRGKEYLCFLGNSVSASGSGVQIVYYSLLEMSKGKVKNVCFFDSRFGLIDNIGDVDKDGQLDFLRISNTGELSNEGRQIFKGVICKTDGKSVDKKYVKLEYLGNSSFKLIDSKWYFDINCN